MTFEPQPSAKTSTSSDLVAPFRQFGASLLYYRQRAERAMGFGGGTPGPDEQSAAWLLDALTPYGFAFDAPHFANIEAGAVAPERAGDFVAAIAACLGLSESEHKSLLHCLAVALLVHRLGREYASVVLGPRAEF